MPASDATFRLYENVGYYLSPTTERPATFAAYQNTGIEPLALSPVGTVIAYENIGIRPGTPLYVTRFPQGWGVLPSGPYTVTVLTESASSTATAYENTV